MKRALLIGTGLVGGLGAVLTIPPPQLGTHSSSAGGLSGGLGGGTPASTQAPATQAPAATPTPAQSTAAATTPAPTKTSKATKKATSKATSKATKKPKPTKTTAGGTAATPTPTQTTAAPAPTPTKSTPPPASSGASGTFTGSAFDANERGRIWGSVTVTITIKNGVITASKGVQRPSSRGQYAFDQIDPYVATQQITIAAIKSKASSALPYVGGATYSSQAYWDSLKSALSQAGI